MESGVLFQFQCMGPIGFASQGPILGLVSSQSFEHVSHNRYFFGGPTWVASSMTYTPPTFVFKMSAS